jgi:hypothetical protein
MKLIEPLISFLIGVYVFHPKWIVCTFIIALFIIVGIIIL